MEYGLIFVGVVVTCFLLQSVLQKTVGEIQR